MGYTALEVAKNWQWWQINVVAPCSVAHYKVIKIPGRSDDIGQVLELAESILEESGMRDFSVEAIPPKPFEVKSHRER